MSERISIKTTRFSTLIKRIFEEYHENVEIYIEGCQYSEKDIPELLDWWCKNGTIKATIDFTLNRDGVSIFGFHDTPDDFWASISERPFIEQLAKDKIIRAKIYPDNYDACLKPRRGKSMSLFNRYFFIALAGFFVSLVNVVMTSCICGHMEVISLPGSLLGVSIGWYAMFKAKNVGFVTRIVIDFVCIATTILLFMNICDILWVGHNPLLY